MAQCYKSLGIEKIMDDESIAIALVSHAIKNGETVVGYYGKPYI